MPEYRIIWGIDVEADTPQDAANESRRTQLDWGNWANHFQVINQETGEVFEIDAKDPE
jgi:hypothetical protein